MDAGAVESFDEFASELEFTEVVLLSVHGSCHERSVSFGDGWSTDVMKMEPVVAQNLRAWTFQM